MYPTGSFSHTSSTIRVCQLQVWHRAHSIFNISGIHFFIATSQHGLCSLWWTLSMVPISAAMCFEVGFGSFHPSANTEMIHDSFLMDACISILSRLTKCRGDLCSWHMNELLLLTQHSVSQHGKRHSYVSCVDAINYLFAMQSATCLCNMNTPEGHAQDIKNWCDLWY